MEKVNKKGRTFVSGKCLGSDLRNLIIDDFIAAGGDPETQYFPGKFKTIADKFKISNSTVRNLWDLFCSNKNTTSRPRGGGNPSHLTHEDLRLIEVLVQTNPSVSLRELKVDSKIMEILLFMVGLHSQHCQEQGRR